jgi:diadenylate cyclase
MLGQAKVWRTWRPARHSVADPLADAAEALSRDCIGALVAIQRDVSLAPYVETGVGVDARLSAALIRTIFMPRSPLHDGAVVVVKGRVVAAGCQLPMRAPDRLFAASGVPTGMRHRAALCLSEDTDAIVLVVSEETGRVSIAFGGRFEPVPRENLARRLVDLLHAPKPVRAAA